MATSSMSLRRALAAVAAAAIVASACSGDDDVADEADVADEPAAEPADDVVTDGAVLPDSNYLGSYELADDQYGTMVTVTVADGVRTIESNSLPDHETGEFPNSGNPNTISEQALNYEFPVSGTYVGGATFAQTPGVAVNGIAFEPATAESLTCASGEVYRVEALQDMYDLGFDVNNAHVQPTGQYHYHGVSQLLVEAYEHDDDLVHVGFAADGFLVYYSKSGAYSSSYVLADETRTGTDCELSLPGGTTIDVEGTAPDGTYTSDYDYVEGAGDLDECMGTTIDGQYAYVVTDEFPFVGRCLNGEFTETFPGGPPPRP